MFDPELKELSLNAQNEFNKTVEVQCMNLADAYGGKICAALDRQHPRDLFDVKGLLDNEGFTTGIKDSFIFYLLSHSRPINELLKPNYKNIENDYNNQFVGMPTVDTTLEDLLETRGELVKKMQNNLTDDDKQFLISFISNCPEWSLFRDSKIKDYPSIKWKLMNQEKIKPNKLNEYIETVRELFNAF